MFKFSVRRPQIWVFVQNALLSYSTMYTDSSVHRVAAPKMSRVTWALLKLLVMILSPTRLPVMKN